MNELQISNRERRLAETISHQLTGALTRRKLIPAFSHYFLTQVDGLTMLIAVLDTTQIGDHARYTNPDLLHQISTDLGGKPTYLSNHSGLRYVILLSALPKLPHKVALPLELPAGTLALGVRFTGQPLVIPWARVTHLAVLGQTGSGKSVFLQALAYQALREEMQLLLSDLDQTTFSALEGHSNLAAPLAHTPAAATALIEQALAECDRRAELYKALPEKPQKITDYNQAALSHTLPPLPRMLVVLDEASAVLNAAGGARGTLGKALATLGWRGRKFGLHFIFAAQEFTKDLLGPVRDQVGLTMCFRVRNGPMAARMGCQGAERIPETRPGLAMSDRYGLLQTYYLEPSRLETAHTASLFHPLPEEARALLTRALHETEGRLTIQVLIGWGLQERAAREMLTTWETRGWVARDPQRNNARYLTPQGLASLAPAEENLSNRPTRPTRPNVSNTPPETSN